ncbi:MAG: phosphatidylserine decarboxylase family protein [Candidatus Rokubacteria bacterium]|nr:phosphatidylserine decarboxylase family protein [Candidatus Rokubacteria bacterium]
MGKLPIAREGWPFVLVPGALALASALLGRRMLALPFAAASLASLGFFRDPERAVPTSATAVLSPADGRVTTVDEAVDPFVGAAVRVSIFLSPLDVHVNRAPISGLVVDTAYTPGRFVAAYSPDAAEVNERCTIRIQGEAARVTVVQIAGVVARRIVCRVGAGDKLEQGQRFGLIRFGSRTDCYMPRGTQIHVAPGDRVTGGVTVLGTLA